MTARSVLRREYRVVVGQPAIDPDAFNAFEASGWEHKAAGYDHFFGGITGRFVEPLLNAVSAGPGTRLLDLATGPGYVAARAADRGASVVGVDVAGAMIALARRLHPEIDFRQADIHKLPFEAGSFDVVVGNFVVLHLGRPEQAMAGRGCSEEPSEPLRSSSGSPMRRGGAFETPSIDS